MIVIHHHSYIFWDIYLDISSRPLYLYLVSWKYIAYSYGDVVDACMKFEHIPLKGSQIDGMQSEKIFDVESIDRPIVG